MNRLARLFVLTLALIVTKTVSSQTTPVVPESKALNLYVGQATVLNEPQLRRIAVGNGKVIQAMSLDEAQVLVIPEAAGQSTLHLWRRDGTEQSYVVSVVPADANRLLTEVMAMLGRHENLSARVVGDKVVLEGHSASEEQASRISEIANRYPQIVNLVSKVGLEAMIEMDVRIVELRRDTLQNLGVRWTPAAQGPSFGVIGDVRRGSRFLPGGAAERAGLPVGDRVSSLSGVFGVASSITSMLQLLVQNGDAVILAEPKLAAKSGGTARFIAGGELPIPYSSGLGATSIAFKEYGIKFDFSPLSASNGLIASKIAAEISAIDFEVQVNGIPGLTKRRAETEVNLRAHETLVIAGLLSEETSKNADKLPALGDVPVLGQLFRSRLFRDRRTDLVVFITPRFVGADVHDTRALSIERRNEASARREQLRMVD
jgi:pilus assembly protein CpaC